MNSKKLIKRGQFLLPLFLFAITQSGCYLHYVNTPINNPMLSEKGETKIEGSISTSEFMSSPHINVAYSFMPHFAANYQYSSYKTYDGSVDPSTLPDANTRGLYNELLLGYYTKLNEQFLFEFYGGLGLGNSSHYYAEPFSFSPTGPGGSSKLKYNKWVMMPAITFKHKNWLLLSYGTRLSFVDFHDVNQFNIADPFASAELNQLRDNTLIILDHGPMIALGGKLVKVNLQYNFMRELSSINPMLETGKFTIGLQFRFKASY